jgi:hypothetical protein
VAFEGKRLTEYGDQIIVAFFEVVRLVHNYSLAVVQAYNKIVFGVVNLNQTKVRKAFVYAVLILYTEYLVGMTISVLSVIFF